MSNHAHRRQARRRVRVDPELIDLVARRAASAAGCWCEPAVKVEHAGHGPVVTVRHDDDCPAVAAPSVFALVPRGHR